MSFDTVIFKKPFEPLETAYWLNVGFKPANGRLVRNGEIANLTVRQNGYFGKDWLMVQASLPKILFGHNARLPNQEQARAAALRLCDYVSSETRLTFTPDDAKAFRIDYTRDYSIREDGAHAIALALLAKELPNFTRVARAGNSVSFSRERDGKVVKQIVVYPKFAWAYDTNQKQSVIEEAQGKLRLEVRLIRRGLTGIKGASKPLDYLSESVSDSLLNEAANVLDLQRTIDARTIDFQERLIVHARGQRSLGKLGVLGFVELIKRYGPDFNKNPEFHYSRSTYYQWKAKLKRIGIWDDLVGASQGRGSYE